MDWMYLFYFSLALLIFFGAKGAGRGNWNEEYTSLKQTKALQGVTALGIALHHMAQKTCAPWHSYANIVHGLDPFIPMGYMFVGVFLFCSGLGLYKSFKTKPDYLKGFVRRRIVPIIIAFYLSEIIYTIVRALMGQQMNWSQVLWYISGLQMANYNSWYVIVIPFFYLVFWAAFRFCKREGTAILWVFVFTLAYTVLGAVINHQDVWWMRGEWWYNSILLFPLGLVFGRFEHGITKTLKKGYWFWLILFFAGFFLLFQQSEWLISYRLGYYDHLLWHRLLSACTQWLVALFYVMFCFTLMMKVKLGNKLIAWFGAVTLEFYLMHGMFVDMFGFSFADVAKSAYYIRNVPVYIAVVMACSVAATLAFRRLMGKILEKLKLNRTANKPDEKAEGTRLPEKILRVQKGDATAAKALRIAKNLIWPMLFLAVSLVMLLGFRKDNTSTAGGLRISPPQGFSQSSADTRQVIWRYTLEDKKPGVLILDREIRGDIAQKFSSVDEVLRDCFWMTDAELYVNPQGIRMARGFSTEYTGYPERRYYVESDGAVFLLCMSEDTRYYNTADCEETMLQTADSIRRQ